MACVPSCVCARAVRLAAGGAGEQPFVRIRGCHYPAMAGDLLPRLQGRRDECVAASFAFALSSECVALDHLGISSELLHARLLCRILQICVETSQRHALARSQLKVGGIVSRQLVSPRQLKRA